MTRDKRPSPEKRQERRASPASDSLTRADRPPRQRKDKEIPVIFEDMYKVVSSVEEIDEQASGSLMTGRRSSSRGIIDKRNFLEESNTPDKDQEAEGPR